MAQWGSGAWDDQDDNLRVNYDAISQMGDSATPAPQTTSSQTGGSPFDALSQPADPFASSQAQPASQQNGTTPSGASGVSAWDSFGQMGDAQSDAQGGSSEFGAAAPPTTSPAAGDTVSKYKTQLEQLGQTTDPRQKAVLQDGIARSLFGELKTAGHDVKWDGDQMVIDGRRYVIGDGSAPASPDVMPRTGGAASPNTLALAGAGAPAPAAGPSLQQGGMTYGGTGLQQNGGGTRFEGFNDERALSGGDPNSAKDAFRRILGSSGINVNGLTKEQTGEVLASQVVPLLQSQGYPVEVIPGAYDQIRVFSNERGWETIDVVGDAGGDARWVWGDLAGGWGGQDMGAGIGGPSAAGTAAMTPGTQGASGVQTQSTPPPTVDPMGDFTPTGPGYTPGAIGTADLPSRSYEDILGGMGEYTPSTIDSTYQFNGFGDTSAATEGGTEALIQKLLANPESLDARTVDMLKGANREEQSAMAESLDDDLTGMGYDMGLDSSAFLASERMGAKRSRDESIIRGNRDIDITAAKTNQGDRRAAAELGAGYSDSVSRRKLAEAQAGEGNKQAASGQKLQADSLNQQNVFNAAQLKSNNAVSAARVQLEQAAALNDRMGLRESVAQAAAELGLSKDKLMADFAMAKANELTQRYGIDVSKYVDLTKLNTAHGEFKEDLAFRLMALQQEMELSYAQLGEGGRQFDVGAGIDLAKLQQNADQFGVDAYYRSLGI